MGHGSRFFGEKEFLPQLCTQRLLLRAMRVSDSADMFSYASEPRVTEHLLWQPHENERATKRYLEYAQKLYRSGELVDWAVTLKETGRMIGTCGFASLDGENSSGEIGYVLHPDFWGRGLAAEALRVVMQYGFETLGLHRIECRHMHGNESSGKVMQKCGMRYEGTLRDSLYVKGRFCTIVMYSVLEEEYAALSDATGESKP